jgi:diguanylate cyclase (GGDEF)-like protein
LEKKGRTFKILLGLALIGTIGLLDILTGYELAFSLFYVLPILWAVWFIDRQYGIIASLVSALVWYGADMAAGNVFSYPLIPVWNTIIKLSFFLMITFLLSALKSSTEREKELACIDYLTGALNSRCFFNLAKVELERSQRYEHNITLAYIDLDNFKTMNDQFGHSTGDQVLRSIVIYTKRHIRKIDVIARLGGDEFVLLLPETSQDSARFVLEKLQKGLLEVMRQNNWPITFSVGVLTCTIPPPSIDELIRMAEDLMYSVKRDGKNAIIFSLYSG